MVYALTLVARTPPKEHGFHPLWTPWRPLLSPPSTSARVHNRFGSVGLGVDMCSSCTTRNWDYCPVLVVPGTRYTRHYIREHSIIRVRKYRVYKGARASPVNYVLASRMSTHIFIPRTL